MNVVLNRKPWVDVSRICTRAVGSQSSVYFGNSTLVGGGISERGFGKTDAGGGGIIRNVETLHEYVAKRKVKSAILTTVRATVGNDEIYGTLITLNLGVEKTRPDLGIRSKTVDLLCKMVNKGCGG
ncbi:hypothetical protein BDR07DRAFT_1376669 [Suillus spraguei]|nr:hypothetical protein BDR07DRAFT_1376669 [Suillus spraguei]